MGRVLCVDIGSTFTKAVLVETTTGELVDRGSVPTTTATDVLDGVDELHTALDAEADLLVSSSAGGGLRLAVVGYERDVTAEAGYRVGLSAGARVEHIACGPLTGEDVRVLRASRPDIVLLVGGTDGGNAEVLLHNARRLAKARIRVPIVVAGNGEAGPEVSSVLESTGRRHVVADNVLPEIGVIRPGPAREAIRAVFLEHVIGGKGLSRGPRLAELVRAATPDAVLDGVGVLADAMGTDIMVIDIGGATTDVYSVIRPQGEDASLAKEIVAPLWRARTVEADLGMRWNARGIVDAADRERLPLGDEVRRYAAHVASAPGHLPADPTEVAADQALARVAATVAARRHGRPGHPGGGPRPLGDVSVLVGSGGVLRHADEAGRTHVLDAVLGDHGGGWRVPDRAHGATDTAYVLFAAGLLARDHGDVAVALCASLGPDFGNLTDVR